MSEKEMKRTNLGITLIALVITIVVLLILAGVSIAMLTGENGILTRANEAKVATEQATKKEQAELYATEMKMTGQICNKPNLKTGMIPVKWNGTAWVKADETNANNDWYDYSKESRQWANVVTVKETGTKTREDYVNATVGKPISMDDITTMFVWIPRYAYKIDQSSYHKTVNGGATIEIEWLEGTTNTAINGVKIVEYNKETTQDYTKFPDGYVVHPAFTENTDMGGTGEEITGFWVGKFESSNVEAQEDNANLIKVVDGQTEIADGIGEDQLYGRGNKEDVTIKPNVTSWRAIDVKDIYNACDNMNEENNIHGLTESTDTTMMQNSQWGAIAYLAQSDYGNKQEADGDSANATGIWNNAYNEGLTYSSSNSYGLDSYSVNLTGVSSSSSSRNLWRNTKTDYYSQIVGTKKNNGDTIEITYQEKKSDGTNGARYTNTYYRYYTENGQKASTTRNIYGVYDMAGGAWEYMASYLTNATDNTYVKNFFLSLNPKYQTGYAGTGKASDDADRGTNYLSNKKIYGDAVWETSNAYNEETGKWNGGSNWNGDYSSFPYLDGPFFVRGGDYNYSSSAGVFYFSHSHGHGSHGVRVIAL